MRYVVTIRRRGSPVCEYLSRNGFRCYTAPNVLVFRDLSKARTSRDFYAGQMPEFELSIERLPPHVSVAKGLLSAVPVQPS